MPSSFREVHSVAKMIDWRGYIHADPAILAGKPVIRGTRISVEFLLGLLAGGWTETMVLENYPQLSREAICAALVFSAECIADSSFYIPPPDVQTNHCDPIHDD